MLVRTLLVLTAVALLAPWMAASGGVGANARIWSQQVFGVPAGPLLLLSSLFLLVGLVVIIGRVVAAAPDGGVD